MPELPEVETVMRGMEASLKGQRIKSAQMFRPNIRFPLDKNMPDILSGARIDHFQRLGKYIIMHLDNGYDWLVHLGMSGRVKIMQNAATYQREKHDHFLFVTEQGTWLIYNDPRRFGILDIVKTSQTASHKLLHKMGVDPFSKDFTPDYLYQALKPRKSNLKTALLDQRLIAGLGNIYVCEALYLARLSPLRKGHDITKQQATNLYHAIIDTLDKAIKAGGSTLRDYSHTDGTLGYFQHQFSVYGKEGQPCPDCICDKQKKNGIIRIVQSGRSSFYCPSKQD